MTIIYSDGMANISIRDGVTRIELFSLKSVQENRETKETKETLEASGVLYLPVSGFLRLHEQLNKAISDMQEKGLIKRKENS